MNARMVAAIAVLASMLCVGVACVPFSSATVSGSDFDGFNVSEFVVDDSHPYSNVETSFSDGCLEVFLPDYAGSSTIDFTCVVADCSLVESIVISSENEQFSENGMIEITDASGGPLDFEEFCTDLVMNGDSIYQSMTFSTDSDFNFHYDFSAPNGSYVKLSISVRTMASDYPELSLDLSEGYVEFDYASYYSFAGDLSGLTDPDMLRSMFALPDGFDLKIYHFADLDETGIDDIGGSDSSNLHYCLVADDSVVPGSYSIGLSMFDLMFSAPSSLSSALYIYPDYSVPFEVVDSSSTPDVSVDTPTSDGVVSSGASDDDGLSLGLLVILGLVVVVGLMAVAGGRRR